MKLFLTLLLCSSLALAAPYTESNPPLLPDARLTPGDVLTTDAKLVCVSGYAGSKRNVKQSLKNAVYKAYGIQKHQAGDWEIDHLISLELGGSNAQGNLWPQSFVTQPLNAHVKDKLEDALHKRVCDGKLPLSEAQSAIALNWTGAYLKYVGPLPAGAKVLLPGQAASSLDAPGSNASSTPPVPSAPTPSSAASSPPNPDGSCPPSAPVKVSKSGIYHIPGERDYAKTHAQSCFASAQDAEAAGYRAPKR